MRVHLLKGCDDYRYVFMARLDVACYDVMYHDVT